MKPYARLVVFVAVALLQSNFALVSFAQTSFEGQPIVGINYMPANILHPSDLARVQNLKIGLPLHAADVAESVDRLFATGEFENITVEAEPAATGVTLRFVTVPVRYLSAIEIKGRVTDPPNRGELSSVPQLTRGNVFHEDDVKEGVDAIQKLLVANGLYESKVAPDFKADASGQQIFLTLAVEFGKRAKYDAPVIHGDAKLPAETVIRATGWRIRFIKRWRQVTQSRTQNALSGIGKKYESQRRLEAQAAIDDLNYDPQSRRVTTTLTLNAGPRVEINAVESKVSQRVLKRYVPVFQEHSVNNDLLAEGARSLRDYFQSKGYFDASVDYRTLMPEADLERIEFVISQGQRYKLVHLTITGNKYFDEQAIRERMFLEPASFYLRRGRYSEAFSKKDEENIANLYRANGFRDVKVTVTRVPQYHGKIDQIGAMVHVDEGAQWLVDSVTFNGVSDEERESFQSELASLDGQPFSEVSMAADRNRVLRTFTSRGFASADFKAEWAPSGTPHHVNIIYTLIRGRQQFVRQILTTGLTHTRQKLVDERVSLHPGDPLSLLAESNIQKRLYDLGVFARVDTAIENPEGDTQYKNVLYALEEANRYTVSLGIGAQVGRFGTPSSSELSAAGGATGFSPQFSIDASRLDFLGIGHTISFRGVYSSLQKRVSTSYYAPRFQNKEGRSLTFSLLYDQTLDIQTFASKRAEASVQLSQKFSRSTTGLFRLAYRQVSVSDVEIPVLLIPQLLQSVRLGVVSANLVRDRRDNSGDPHHGSYNTADFSLATRYLGSQRNFARGLVRNATYYRLSKNITLARQTQFGVIVPFAAPTGITYDEAVPLPERFFGGGADSLRAFPYNQAGPRDTGAAQTPGGPSSPATGFPLGGNALVFNNVEVRFPLIGENIQGVVFHDVGNVYRSLSDISFRFHQRNDEDFNYAVHAVGFGVRYRTPIGPVRGDLAYSVNPPGYLGFSGTPADLLLCGPAGSALPNCQSTPQKVSHFQFFFSIGQTF